MENTASKKEKRDIIINLPENDRVSITAVSVKFKCNECGNIFGIYLNERMELPSEYWVCFHCVGKQKYFESKEREQKGVKETNYGYKT